MKVQHRTANQEGTLKYHQGSGVWHLAVTAPYPFVGRLPHWCDDIALGWQSRRKNASQPIGMGMAERQ